MASIAGLGQYQTNVITVDSTADGLNQATTSGSSWNHTVNAGADQVLVVCVAMNDTGAGTPVPTSITFGGVALTERTSGKLSNTTHYSAAWYLTNPAQGTGSIVVNFSGTITRLDTASICLNNVNVGDTPYYNMIRGSTNTTTGGATPTQNAQSTVVDNQYVISFLNELTGFGTDSVVTANETLLGTAHTTAGRTRFIAEYFGPNTPAGLKAMAFTATGTRFYYEYSITFTPRSIAGTITGVSSITC